MEENILSSPLAPSGRESCSNTMNLNLMTALTRYRPTAKEYQKSALAVSHAMVTTLKANKDQVDAGSLSREQAIKQVRYHAGIALQRLNVQAQEMNALTTSLHNAMTGAANNATDVVEVTKELLDIAQEVALEIATTLRTIRANWDDYEVLMQKWVADIQKGLK